MTSTFKCLKLRRLNKNGLLGFFSLKLPSGLVLHDLSWRRQPDGTEWVGMPSRAYQAGDGSTKWTPVAEFDADAKRERQEFQRRALTAVRAFVAAEQNDDELAELLP